MLLRRLEARMPKLTSQEQMLYATMRISTFQKETPLSVGTGFFWGIERGGKHAVVLVTNNHVIDGADTLSLDCHIADNKSPQNPTGATAIVRLELSEGGIFRHPDPTVDLCMLDFSSILDIARAQGTEIFLKSMSRDLIPSDWDAFDAVEEVFMAGCPQGIYDEFNKFPLVRKGITATAMYRPYNGANEFMVDMACFPGSSGSPVFVNQNGYTNKRSSTYEMSSRFHLVGILHAGPTFSNSGEVVLGRQPSVQIATMMHLGQVIRADALLEIEDLVISHMEGAAGRGSGRSGETAQI